MASAVKSDSARPTYYRHLEVHLSSNHMCRICKEIFTNQDLLDQHFLVKHPTKSPYHCDFCNEDFISKLFLDIHDSDYHKHASNPQTCVKETKKCSSKQTLTKKNVYTHLNITARKRYSDSFATSTLSKKHSNKLLCPVCLESFVQKDSLRLHFRSIHVCKTDSVYVCQVCDIEKPNAEMMCSHLEVHSSNLLSVNRLSGLRTCANDLDSNLYCPKNQLNIKFEQTEVSDGGYNLKQKIAVTRIGRPAKRSKSLRQNVGKRVQRNLKFAHSVKQHVKDSEPCLLLPIKSEEDLSKKETLKIQKPKPIILKQISEDEQHKDVSYNQNKLKPSLSTTNVKNVNQAKVICKLNNKPKETIIFDNVKIKSINSNRLRRSVRTSSKNPLETIKSEASVSKVSSQDFKQHKKSQTLKSIALSQSVIDEKRLNIIQISDSLNAKQSDNKTVLNSTPENISTLNNDLKSREETPSHKFLFNKSSDVINGDSGMDISGIMNTRLDSEDYGDSDEATTCEENKLLSGQVSEDIPPDAELQPVDNDTEFASSKSETEEEICCTMCSLIFYNQDDLLDHVATHI